MTNITGFSTINSIPKQFKNADIDTKNSFLGVKYTEKTDSFEKKPDLANDNKFSKQEAFKNFGKGLISPITSMFSSVSNFAAGAGIMAASGALIAATGGAAAPLLIVAGAGLGAVQTGSAILKIIKAKNADEAEKAFFEIGSAVSTLGFASVGSKFSLRNAGYPANGSSVLNSTKTCFQSVSKSLKDSLNSFITGEYKTNISRLFAAPSKSKEIMSYSRAINKEARFLINECVADMKEIFPEKYHKGLISRIKSAPSIYDKISNKINNKGLEVKTLNDAKGLVDDLIGTRLILSDARPSNVDEVVISLAKAMAKKKIDVQLINNYRGPNGKPYFSDEHIKILKSVASKRGINLKVKDDAQVVKSSGYTTAQIKIRYKNGMPGEFQIRGQHINDIAEIEHIPYDLRKGKDITQGIPKLQRLFAGVKKAAESMSEEQCESYSQYLTKMYEYSRLKEMGLSAKEPEFPKGIDNVLSINKLELIDFYAKSIKKYDKTAKTTASFVTGAFQSAIASKEQ